MVKYADKKVGQIIDKVKAMHIESETIVIVLFGDNGTREGITSMFNGEAVPGGRLNATEHGTHVPMFVYWPGKVAAGSVNNDLVSFVDILPTIAGIAKVPVPTNYGPLDGVSFYPRMIGEPGTAREWIFCHYEPFLNVEGNDKIFRWVQNKEYKYYDTGSSKLAGKFFKLVNFSEEQPPLSNDVMSTGERALKDSFQVILSKMHN
jgi:arylsulfatase A